MIERRVPFQRLVTGSSPGIKRLAIPFLFTLAIFLAVSFAVFRWAENHSGGETARKAGEDARVQASLLNSELQKFRLLPTVLPDYPQVIGALEQPNATQIADLNRTLELLAKRTDAAAIYLLDQEGLTIAASNWQRSDSFVGQRYAFRPYFSGAMRDGSAQLFALGTVSGRPGLYIARRIDKGSQSIGVIVVKVEFDAIERIWQQQAGAIIVTDPKGIVLITNRPEWRFKTITKLDQQTRVLARRSLQFGDAPLDPLPIGHDGTSLVINGDDYRAGTATVPLLNASVMSFQPRRRDRVADLGTARTFSLILFIVIAAIFASLVRARERRQMEDDARAALERQVAERTVELTNTNRLLRAESLERARADERFRSSREELAQANRLGSLGQITAGVAHEINQPVAAIRTFSENALKYLSRGEIAKVTDNLDTIVAMTERIGAITTELRRFARKRTPEIGAVGVNDVIEGTLLLVGDQLRTASVTVIRPSVAPNIKVAADRVRLEQILVNLVQNSIQAMTDAPQPWLEFSVAKAGKGINLAVADNGRGIDPAIADEIFTPFVTSRPDGLGLGLAIAREIAREFGGDLSVDPSVKSGTRFILRLKRA